MSMEYYFQQAIDLVKTSFGSGATKKEEVELDEIDKPKPHKTLKSMYGDVRQTLETDAIKNKSLRENEGNHSRKLKKSVSDRKTPFSFAFYVKLIKGVYCFAKGSMVAFEQPPLRKAFFSTLKIILFGVLASYLLIFFLTFPIRILISFFSWLGVKHLESVNEMLDTKQIIDDIAYFIPLFVIGILRYVVPTFNEDMFYFVLESQDKKLSDYLKNRKILKTYPMIGYIKRFSKLAIMGILIYIFSLIPYVGDFVLAVAQFYYSYRPIGKGSAAVLSCLSLIPSTKSTAANILKSSMAAQSLGKELLEVYFSKLPDVKQELYIYRRFYGWMFGFSIAWMTMLRIPFFGTCLWTIAQGSVGFFVLKLLQRNKLKYDNNETQMILLGQDQLSEFEESPVLTAKKLK